MARHTIITFDKQSTVLKKETRVMGGPRTLADILVEIEYNAVKNGTMIAVAPDGGKIKLSSRVNRISVIKLMPTDSEQARLVLAEFTSPVLPDDAV